MMEFACLLLTSATAPVAMAQGKVIKKAPMGQSDPSSGKAMYTSYCAPCHGASGKGDGPVASEFKVAPANLTQFTRTTKVSFLPAISGHAAIWRAHSGAWLEQCAGMGNLFGSLDPHDPVKVNQSIQTLVDYVKTLQAN